MISLFILSISLLLSCCASEILSSTGTNLINDVVFISGILMCPTNLYMMLGIARNRKISHKGKLGVFPLWMCILLIVIINIIGSILCIRRMLMGGKQVQMRIAQSMASYRTCRNHQRFIDNLQWSLKCCGLNSYKDWFTRDWYDKSRDYEWDPSPIKRFNRNLAQTDSVPLSCCKSGSCISNYLTELGTNSINTEGCSPHVNRLIKIYVIVHLIIFVTVIIIELLTLNYITKKRSNDSFRPPPLDPNENKFNVKHLMGVKDNFRPSSGSNFVGQSEESDDESS
ncbi:tetraspanin family domain-containing protein [Phthorimaea operculella]|nr:tetraspanin family domain-containing protein [Phthorimaea operculella]